MSKRILGLALTIQLVVECGTLKCQITSVNSDRHLIVGARVAALGDAGVVDYESINDMYYNPASISFITTRGVDATGSLERLDNNDFTMVENVAFPVIVDNTWALGLGATFSHVGKAQSGGPNGGLNYQLFVTDVAISNALTRSLSLGIGLNGGFGFADSVQLGTLSSSVGLFYIPEPGISYGIVVQGFGWGLGFSADSGRTVMKRNALDRSFQIGVSLRFPKNADRPLLSLLFATQKLLNRNELVYKSGVEVFPVTFATIRWGYWLGRHSSAAKYGAGIRFGRVGLDYAVSPSELEPRFHQASISYALGSQ